MTMTSVTSMGYTGPVGRERVTAPAVPLLTIEDARSRLRLPFTDEDDQLQAFIEAATESAEEHLGRRLAPQVWRFWYDGTPRGRVITFPEPVRSIAAVTSYATDDDTVGTVLTASEYVLDGRRDRIVIDESTTLWPVSSTRRHNACSIEAAVGYASVAAVPAPIVQAVHLKVKALYLREDEPSVAVKALLAPYRYRMGIA